MGPLHYKLSNLPKNKKESWAWKNKENASNEEKNKHMLATYLWLGHPDSLYPAYRKYASIERNT